MHSTDFVTDHTLVCGCAEGRGSVRRAAVVCGCGGAARAAAGRERAERAPARPPCQRAGGPLAAQQVILSFALLIFIGHLTASRLTLSVQLGNKGSN